MAVPTIVPFVLGVLIRHPLVQNFAEGGTEGFDGKSVSSSTPSLTVSTERASRGGRFRSNRSCAWRVEFEESRSGLEW